jgi:hypothetical protein
MRTGGDAAGQPAADASCHGGQSRLESMDSEASSCLRELQTPDEMSLVFNPIGFGGRMEPGDAARFQASAIANAVLLDDVPSQVRENFERARKLHLYGVLEYEFFTAASDYALLVLEAGLRHRFISHYDYEVPVFNKSTEGTFAAPSFDDVREARGCKLRAADGTMHELPRSLSELFDWARRERLLPGTRTRIVDGVLAELRNHAAHPVGRVVEDPLSSARTLRDVAEIINRLWGHDTPGGRLFPGPLARWPRVAALAPDGSAACEMGLQHVAGVNSSERGWGYGVFLATEHEELTRPSKGRYGFVYKEGFQTAVFPCEQLWRGDWNGLNDAVKAGVFSAAADTTKHLDRLFFMRVGGDTIDEARSASDLLGLDSPPQGRWYAVVADTPFDAYAHVKNHEGELSKQTKTCPQCFARIRGRFKGPSDAVALARRYVASGEDN